MGSVTRPEASLESEQSKRPLEMTVTLLLAESGERPHLRQS
jgi:hypothetical protein